VIKQDALAIVNFTLAAPQDQAAAHEMTFGVVSAGMWVHFDHMQVQFFYSLQLPHQAPPFHTPGARDSCRITLTTAVCRCPGIAISAAEVPLDCYTA
jgi:hypothetical protein